MPGMSDMHMELPRLTWSVFFSSWEFRPLWTAFVVAAAAAYLYGTVVVRRRGEVRFSPLRTAAFLSGLLVLLVSVSSAIETYSHVLFWDHMVQHLLLIMVVPALLVVGHPWTLAHHATSGSARLAVNGLLGSRPFALLTHPLVGLALYTLVIVGTHLTSFMDQMATRMWLHDAEQILYLVSGYLFLLPLLGNEPIRWRLPPLVRMVVLFIAMAPDTVVGIVLLQTNSEMFPTLASHRPGWAPDSVHDLNIGGGIMWAFGDGLMMLFILAVMVAYVTNPNRDATAGNWLEGVRRRTMAHHVSTGAGQPTDLEDSVDIDDDEASLAAYNQMLQRMNERDQR